MFRCYRRLLVVLLVTGTHCFLLLASGSRQGNNAGCGSPSTPVSVTSGRKRVTGGIPTTTTSFPWMVVIKDLSDRGARCGGAVVSDRLILTAAHCLDNVNKNSLQFLVGVDSLSTWNFHMSIHYASGALVHEHYDPITKANDIALVVTRRRINFGDNVRPVCLPESSTPSLDANARFLFAGYGDTQGTGSDGALHYMHVPLISDNMCSGSDWLGSDFDVIRNVSFCAGYADGGPDACSGDSGGALVYRNEMTHTFYVYGLSSWGKGCGERHKPGVYTKVTRYLDWIKAGAAQLLTA